jgi:L-ascorbate metabolism protein UlaG (beta-lactamase superfamily)
LKKHSIISRRRFVTLGCLGAAGLSSGFWLKTSSSWAAGFLRERLDEVKDPIKKPRFKPDPAQWNPNAITASWLGHSTVLINFYGVRLITDPALFSRVGANLGLGTIGPKRLIAPALRVRELPMIDVALLSHAHLDHLDVPTLRRLRGSPFAVTAKSTADILRGTRLRPTELNWGESVRLATPHGEVRIEAFQVKHWGARWRRDSHRGYNGYIVEREGKKILFGGDTAFSPTFAALRSKGPFEIAMMPIGAYQPWIVSHCTPEEAVAMANQAGGKRVLPIHHQTFRLGRELRMEPLERLEAALAKEPERIALREVGESFSTA